MKKKIIVNDLMQKDYVYFLTEPIDKNFHEDFKPELTPKQMLSLGIFGGKYRFNNVKLSPNFHNPKLNYFKINASKSLKYWVEKGWIYHEDPRGWFQWYCRYYMGRRCLDDVRQIKRWKAMKRHITQVTKKLP